MCIVFTRLTITGRNNIDGKLHGNVHFQSSLALCLVVFNFNLLFIFSLLVYHLMLQY